MAQWLTDYLMHPFVMTLRWLGWEREIAGDDSRQCKRYANDREYC